MKNVLYIFLFFITSTSVLDPMDPELGQIIDSYNGVEVFYNGNLRNVSGRNITEDGYNLGLKYQCIEFVKRYYYTVYDHKMPDSYGHAKEFFDLNLDDGQKNKGRELYQYKNGSQFKPYLGDIVVFDSNKNNAFGHAGIICNIQDSYCEIIQQNVGEQTRARYKIIEHNSQFYLSNRNILGWLRK